MKGISYITDEKGNKTAIIINLKNYHEEVEDFLDGLEAQSRLSEPSVDFEKSVNKILNSKSGRGKISSKNKKSAEKELEALPHAVILKIRAEVLLLANNPLPQGYKKLKGLKDIYRIRIRDYRVIYTIHHHLHD